MLRSDTTAVAALVVAVLLAYFNALGAAFQFDDINVIVDNLAVHSFAAWSDSMPGIRPLLKFSYALNWTLHDSPFGFHLFNVALHAVNTVLVYRLLQSLSRAQSLAPEANWCRAPLIGAMLFALHPVQTEAVTYISGRSVSLMALFYLGSALAWMRVGHDEAGRSWRLFSALLFGLALLVKETAVTLPLALLLLDAWALHEPGDLRQRLLRLRWHFLVLAFSVGVMLASTTYRHLLDVSLSARGMLDNLLTQVNAVCWLARQIIMPWNLNADPDLPVITAMSLPLLLQVIVVAGILYAGFRGIRSRRWLAFAVLWLFLHLLPTNSLLPRLDVANDRQLYLALIGGFFVIGLGVEALATRFRRPQWLVGVALALLLALGIGTFQRNETYASPIAFWEDALAKSPRKARVANNLGYAYQQAGRLAEAKLAYQQAIAADPDYWRARINLEALEAAEKR
ncbi:MAG TPA: hypothetical protein VHB46_02955 [Burkholderiales bacterium]|nr:hypothetical protein [Burkholderiales bacterium]